MLHTTYGALGYGLLLFYPHDWLHSSPVGPATAQSPSPVSPKSLVLRPAVAALAGPQGGTAGSAHRSWPGSEARARSRPVWSGPSCSIQRPGTWLILAGSATRWSLKMIEDVQKEDVGKVKNGRNPGRPGSSSSSLYLCLTVDSIQKESLNQHQELLQPTFCGSPPLSQQDSKV